MLLQQRLQLVANRRIDPKTGRWAAKSRSEFALDANGRVCRGVGSSRILTAVKRRQRPSGAPQAPSSPEPAERPQERPQARETPPQAPQEPPKPIRTKKALTDRFKTRLDERLAGLQRNMTNDEFAKQIANVNRRLLALNFEFQNEEHDIIQFALAVWAMRNSR